MTTATTNNGHGAAKLKGRAVPELDTFTFSSGYTVRVHRLPPMTQQRVAEAIQRMPEVRGVARPTPPKIVTDLGVETNEADPEYKAQLVRWNEACALELNDRLLLYTCLDAIEITLDDAARERIARKRRTLMRIGAWQDDPELDAEENDRLLFVQHIAAETGEDLQGLYQAVMRRSEPTEEAVQEQLATFPGDAPGA